MCHRQQTKKLIEAAADKLDQQHYHFKKLTIAGLSAGAVAGVLGLAAAATFWFPLVAIWLAIFSAVTGLVGAGMSMGSTIGQKTIESDKIKNLQRAYEEDECKRASIKDSLEKVIIADNARKFIPLGAVLDSAMDAEKTAWLLVAIGLIMISSGAIAGAAGEAFLASGLSADRVAASSSEKMASSAARVIPIIGGVVSTTIIHFQLLCKSQIVFGTEALRYLSERLVRAAIATSHYRTRSSSFAE